MYIAPGVSPQHGTATDATDLIPVIALFEPMSKVPVAMPPKEVAPVFPVGAEYAIPADSTKVPVYVQVAPAVGA